MSESALDRPAVLEELVSGSGTQDALGSLARLVGVPLALVGPTGRTVVQAGMPSPLHELIREEVPGQDLDEAKLAEVRAVQPRFDDVEPHVVSCYTGCRYAVAALVIEGNEVGQVAMGPYRDATSPPCLDETVTRLLGAGRAGQAQALYEAVPLLDADEASTRVTEVAATVSVLGASQHVQKVTGQLHLAAIEDTYAQLTDKTKRLTEAVSRMQEVDRLKSHFLANISHELRTPLTSVIGYSEMLLEGLAGELTDEQSQYIRTIMEKGDQLLQIVSGVLDVSRIESGTLKVTTEPLDLAEIIALSLRAVRPLAERKKIQLEVELFDPLPPVQGDREKIRQIVVNLVSNGIKFTPAEGRVAVSADVGFPGRVGFPDGGDLAGDGDGGAEVGRFDPDSVRIHVRDSGIGMRPDELTRIFEPFFQVDSSSTREYGGTGLGLTLVKNFVEAQGGRVWVESEPGQGSCFTVALPRAAPDAGRKGRGQTVPGHGQVTARVAR